jgi:hypothetical protein
VTFSDWYNATIVPQLEETLKSMPVVAREALRTASRRTMAACWNAALDAADEWLDKPETRVDRSAYVDANGIDFEELRA